MGLNPLGEVVLVAIMAPLGSCRKNLLVAHAAGVGFFILRVSVDIPHDRERFFGGLSGPASSRPLATNLLLDTIVRNGPGLELFTKYFRCSIRMLICLYPSMDLWA